MAQRVRSFTLGDRVRFIGRSVQVASPGETGTIIDLIQSGPSMGMVEVAWDQGASSYCWPSELEHA